MRRLLLPLLVSLGALLVRALTASLRLTTLGRAHREAAEAAGPPLYAFWHGRQMPLLGWDRPRPLAVLVSWSRDGDLQARLLRRLGFVPIRGSGGKGGARGLVALIREVRRGLPAAFAVDGGRGPVHTVHEGVLVLAARTGRPVIPVGASVRRRRVLTRSWDRFLIPAPFARGAVVLGEPLEVPADAGRETLARLAAELSRRIHAATAEADAACGAPPEPAAVGDRPCPSCAARQAAAAGTDPQSPAPPEVAAL